jgi:hypothetical protein
MFYICQRFTTNQYKSKERVQIKGAKFNRRQPWSGAPDCPVCHRTVSGAPPDSVRCTRESNSKLASLGNYGGRSAIIHRTVRCASRATATSRQRSSAERIQCATVRSRVRAASEGAPDSVQWLSGDPEDRSSNGRTLTVGWRGWRTG